MKTTKPTALRNFYPLVEASPEGSSLRPIIGRSLIIPWEERCRHLMVVGKNGSGKTSRVVIPFIFEDICDPEKTVVILDPQLDLTAKVVSFTRKVRGPNAKIIYVNPLDPEHSARWNPIAGITDPSTAYDLSSTMSAACPRGTHDSPYFRDQAIDYLASLIQAFNTTMKGKATFELIRETLRVGADAVRQLGQHFPDLIRFADEIRTGNKNSETTLSELNNLFLAWRIDDVCEVTSSTDFSFDDLESEPCVFILGIPEQAVEKLRPFTNALFHRLMEFLMRRGQQNGGTLRRPFSLVIDEFASAVGKLPDFHLRANTLRKRGVAITAAIQTLKQLQDVYGSSAESLQAAFNHWILVPPLASSDADYFARESGFTTVQEVVTSDGNQVTGVHPVTRTVLTPDEIAHPAKHPKLGPRMTFLLADTPPFQGYLRGYWEDKIYKKILSEASDVKLPARGGRDSKRHSFKDVMASIPPQNGISDTAGWTDKQLLERIQQLKMGPLAFTNASFLAGKWWQTFEATYKDRLGIVLRFMEELALRKATIAELFESYQQANCDNIRAILHFLDYKRLKKEDEKKRGARGE